MQTDGRVKADSRLAQVVCENVYLLIGYNDEVIGERYVNIRQYMFSEDGDTSFSRQFKLVTKGCDITCCNSVRNIYTCHLETSLIQS
jgi:hypothetical protein